jgi:sulfite reductase (NADPH) hemoprotein beta-component
MSTTTLPSPAAVAPSPNELLKASTPDLSGTLAQTLLQADADHFNENENQLLKFHGTYQQDDRDLRKTGKKYIFMVRVRMPGGVLSPAQYLALDELAGTYANRTLPVTSRQGIQFHGIIKRDLWRSIRSIHETLLTTLAACGDVARNVMAPSLPGGGPVSDQMQEDASKVSGALLPATPAYHQIWLDGEEVKQPEPVAPPFEDPLYGKTYLPRKFKVGFALPPNNDVDILTQCVGYIAIVENGQIVGYNLTAGGGMGKSHGNAETFPRLADVVGYIPRAQVVETTKAILGIHRDFGDRANRKHARLKYILADRGVAWFRTELEQRLGGPLAPARPYAFTKQGDPFGWHQRPDGKWNLGVFVETGRIRDHDTRQARTGLREIVKQYQPEVWLTPGNNLLLAGFTEAQRDGVNQLLARHGIAPWQSLTLTRTASMACVALPTCGLALAEAERYLPTLMTQIEQAQAETGLADEEIIVRMTGCPNGCARPYMAEIAFVGRAPGKYQLYLGGNRAGTRLNRLYKDSVKDADLVGELKPLLVRFKAERIADERFGDWVARTIWQEQAA